MTLLAPTSAFLAGVYLALRFDTSAPALGLFLLASVFILALPARIPRFPLAALIPVAMLLGLLRVEAFGDSEPSMLVMYHSNRPLQVYGVVISDPEAAGVATRFRLRVDKIKDAYASTKVSGDALVTLRESTELARLRERPFVRYGDRLLLHGKLEAPPVLEEFGYPAYLARQGIGSVMSFPSVTLLEEGRGPAFYGWLYGMRRRVADSLATVVPEPQASLGQALLLGLRDNLPDELVEEFRNTGTSHVLAISGLHVGVLLAMSLAVSRWVLGRRRQIYLVIPLGLMWLYALLSGMSPSVTRASIMGSVYLAALLLGRPRSVLPAMAFAAAVMVAVNPEVLRSVSFQLSFTAIAGIALLAETLSRRTQTLLGSWSGAGADRSRTASIILPPISDILAMGIAATVATLPLVAFYFERVSLVGVPATILVLPALPFVLAAQAAAGVIGLLSASVAQPFAWVAWLATGYVSGIVGQVARVPVASVETGVVAPLLVWAYYGVIVLLYAAFTVLGAPRRWMAGVADFAPSMPVFSRGVPWWVLVPVVSVAALLCIAALSLPDTRLHVVFVDVGQGDAAFISTPTGQQVLVDGGADPVEMAQFLGKRMPFWDRTVELVVLTHAHSDHVTGLVEVLRRYRVERILERQVEYESPQYLEWRRAVADEGVEVTQAQPGQLVALGGGAFIQVLNPPEKLLRGTSSDVDNASVVLRLVYDDVAFMLTGDMFSEAEEVLVQGNTFIESDVLKVGHHGSRTSSSSAFLDAVSPAIAVISVGEDNRFGHPESEVLQALGQRLPEELLFLTSENGTIEFVTDGRRLEVKTER